MADNTEMTGMGLCRHDPLQYSRNELPPHANKNIVDARTGRIDPTHLHRDPRVDAD